MKKKIIPILFIFLILYCLLFPGRMSRAVTDGLTLWYRSILPALLPFSIFSNIIVRTGVYDRFFKRLAPVFGILYPVRSPLIYPLLAGFLFGFPLGSKICAELCRTGKITPKEAEIISSVSNNFGPGFLYNYLYLTVLDGQIPLPVIYAACYLPPLLLGRILLSRYYGRKKLRLPFRSMPDECPHEISRSRRVYFSCGEQNITHEKPASGSQINMETLDAGIMDAFATMIKLAGYIILSALLAEIIRNLPLTNDMLRTICIGAVEITNGLQQIENTGGSPVLYAFPAVGIVNFGGFCGLCQTSSMLRSTGVRFRNYTLFKLMCSLCGMLFLLIYCH